MTDRPPRLSVIVVAYEMARELPRTVRSLSPALQRGIDADDYEIVVVDNGSAAPVPQEALAQWGGNVRCISVERPGKSPVPAVNAGLAAARGDLCGVFIDGARMATPGLLAHALAAGALSSSPVISTVGFHLGPEHQSQSAGKGYEQRFEDFLLASIDWTADAYRLFLISCFAGSSPHGWFGPVTESNGLFMKRSAWQALGGYEERFASAGGGLSNLDVFKRAVERWPDELVVLLGEGTFHQYHGGVSSNATQSKWPDFQREYAGIRGRPWECPQTTPRYFGSVHRHAAALMEVSAKALQG